MKFHPLECFQALSPLYFFKISLNSAAICVNFDLFKYINPSKTSSKNKIKTVSKN
jgi:hypothetical protein